MEDKEIVWLHGEVKSPPFSDAARVEIGTYLRQLQRGFLLSMPHSRYMRSVGPRCHELRVTDETNIWRIMYRIDDDAIIVCDVFKKKTQATPPDVIKNCKTRLALYDSV